MRNAEYRNSIGQIHVRGRLSIQSSRRDVFTLTTLTTKLDETSDSHNGIMKRATVVGAKRSVTRNHVIDLPRVAMVSTASYRPVSHLVSRAILSVPVHIVPRKGQRLEIPTEDKMKRSGTARRKRKKKKDKKTSDSTRGSDRGTNETMWCTAAFNISTQTPRKGVCGMYDRKCTHGGVTHSNTTLGGSTQRA